MIFDANFRDRVKTSLFLIALFLVSLKFFFPYGLILIVLVAATLTNYEIISFVKSTPHKTKIVLLCSSLIPVYAAATNVLKRYFVDSSSYLEILVVINSNVIVCAVFALVSGMYWLIHKIEEDANVEPYADTLLNYFLVTAYSSFLFVLMIKNISEATNMMILWLVLVVVVNDSVAYIFGKTFGKRFFPIGFAPRLSPNKTVEGTVMGFVSAVLVGYLFLTNFANYSHIMGGILSCATALFAIFGDLIQSMIKRIYNVKNSSEILPGHGGVFDRVDAVLFASIILYYT